MFRANRPPKDWNLKAYLKEHGMRVEKRLRGLPLVKGRTTRALEAMQYALSVPGKRFRPLLMIATADIYRLGHDERILDAACAIECVHTASLIFDDLPCMDDASLRRGQPPTHLKYGEDQAILAAMCLIAEANNLIAQHHKGGKTALKQGMEAIYCLNESFSADGLSGGQSDDLLNKSVLTMEELEYIHAKKTGALFIACTQIAGILCRASSREQQWLESFAKNLGLAFQIQDDLLDLESSDVTGKDSGADEEKTTFLDLFGPERCKQLYEDLIQVALQNLTPFGDAAFHLRALTAMIQARGK